MTNSSSLPDDRAAQDRKIARCARCGKCRSVCPTFELLRHERFVARGRIAAMRQVAEGGKVTPIWEETWQSCLGCHRCEFSCPSGVAVGDLVSRGKELAAARSRWRSVARLVWRFVLTNRGRMDVMLRVAAFFQRLLGWQEGQVRHLSLAPFDRRALPALADRTALSRLAGVHPAVGLTRDRVIFFTGCLINHARPDIAAATVSVLTRLGVEVTVPAEQLCCGMPFWSLGETALADELRDRNLGIFRTPGAPATVITACASCGGALRQKYESAGITYLDLAVLLSRLLREVFPSLSGPSSPSSPSPFSPPSPSSSSSPPFPPLPLPPPLDRPYSYHVPCHLRFTQKEQDSPLAILSLMGAYQPLDAADACCGGGGAFSVFYPEWGRRIGEKKVAAMKKNSAPVVLSSCPGCLLTLEGYARQEGLDREFLHLVQAVDRWLRNHQPELRDHFQIRRLPTGTLIVRSCRL